MNFPFKINFRFFKGLWITCDHIMFNDQTITCLSMFFNNMSFFIIHMFNIFWNLELGVLNQMAISCTKACERKRRIVTSLSTQSFSIQHHLFNVWLSLDQTVFHCLFFLINLPFPWNFLKNCATCVWIFKQPYSSNTHNQTPWI
jgi:hypothetical protein